jgi:hypothetical protein
MLTMLDSGGSLKSGTYSVAISWLRDQQESALSQIASDQISLTSNSNLDDPSFSSIQVNLPYCFDQSITHVRIYILIVMVASYCVILIIQSVQVQSQLIV